MLETKTKKGNLLPTSWHPEKDFNSSTKICSLL